MAHFNLENEINEATRWDAPLEKGPLARWQRKALEAGVKSLSLDAGLNMSGLSAPRSATTCIKTPRTPLNSTALLAEKVLGKTPRTPRLNNGKTPKLGTTPGHNKTPGKKGLTTKTPSKSAPNTPHNNQDRFIPNRSTMDLETGHYILAHGENVDPDQEVEDPEDTQFTAKMSRALSENNLRDHKILSFNQKAPKAKEDNPEPSEKYFRILVSHCRHVCLGYLNNLKVLYNGGGATSTQKTTTVTRHIPNQPDRIMDAPELVDDYYLNLLSWSSNNHLAVALATDIYLWNAGDGSITQLPMPELQDEYISSVAWVKEGNYLALGTSSGAVQLWDVGQQKLMRSMTGHAARVGSLSWNSYILSSGSRTGAVHHHDVRVPEHHVGTLRNHSQEVCGLAWSPDGRHLATGANDNLVNIWDASLSHETQPLHTFTEHQAAVKALSWCPWQGSLLATGGGTADRHIRFWNVTTGTCVNSIDTNSQVCSILWSKEYKELISGHGFSQNQLSIWKYPSLGRVTNLMGHQSRILSLALSPDGTTVASAAADETIRLWKCFAVDKQAKTTTTKTKQKSSSSVLMKGIR